MGKYNVICLILTNIQKYGVWDKFFYHTKRDIKKYNHKINEKEIDEIINKTVTELSDKGIIEPIPQSEMSALDKQISRRGHITMYRIVGYKKE